MQDEKLEGEIKLNIALSRLHWNQPKLKDFKGVLILWIDYVIILWIDNKLKQN